VRKCTVILVAALIAPVYATPAAAQDKPVAPDAATEDARRKAEQAGRDNFNKMAAEQAEAVERARLKVAQELAREEEQRAREEQAKERARRSAVVPVDVEVVISRFDGDKKVGSLPYALTVNAAYDDVRSQHRTILKMGGDVPVPMMSPALGPDGKPVGLTGGGPVQYRYIGTQIDAAARPLDDGRFELFVSVEDTALAPPPAGAPPGAVPALRKFASQNTIVLRDGQTRQFTAAADRITGEVVRVDVTLRVAK
jgi:hypothetical protein